jgi:hypothetical protein
MTTKTQWSGGLLTVAFVLAICAVSAQDQQSQPQPPAGAVTVNELAEKPGDHLGRVQLVGVVAVVLPGKGFVLVDRREYADCGLTCLAEPRTNKIPVRWSGDAPKLEESIRVAGILSQSKEGLSFVAQEIGIP